MIQSKVVKKYGDKVMATNETEMFEREAAIAIACIERWGMVAGIPDGEDSSGRARIRLAAPQELVDRGFEVARLVMKKARGAKLMHSLPDISEFGE